MKHVQLSFVLVFNSLSTEVQDKPKKEVLSGYIRLFCKSLNATKELFD